jgi:hypothetical protein
MSENLNNQLEEFLSFSNNCAEIFLLETLGYPIIDSAKIIKDNFDINSNKKKIVFTDLQLWTINLNDVSPISDLSWADVVVCFTPEVIYLDWEEQNRIVSILFQNKNLIYIAGGTANKNYPENRLFSPYLYYFMTVNRCNTEIDYTGCDGKRLYKFDALLGVNRWFRKEILNLLMKNNLIDECLAFLYDVDPSKKQFIEYQTPNLNSYEDPLILEWKHAALTDPSKKYANYSTSKKTLPSIDISASWIISHKIYQNSWFSIVSETMFNEFRFLTEKTAKCLFAKRVFVLFAGPGSLQFLRDQGFKTFHGIIDESYDFEPNQIKRLHKAFDQIKFLSTCDPVKIYQQAQSILEHNFNLITTSNLNIGKIQSFISNYAKSL